MPLPGASGNPFQGPPRSFGTTSVPRVDRSRRRRKKRHGVTARCECATPSPNRRCPALPRSRWIARCSWHARRRSRSCSRTARNTALNRSRSSFKGSGRCCRRAIRTGRSNRILEESKGFPQQARDALLHDGYLYAEDPNLAYALVSLVQPNQLFGHDHIWIQRGEQVLHADEGTVDTITPTVRSKGEKVRLLLVRPRGRGRHAASSTATSIFARSDTACTSIE